MRRAARRHIILRALSLALMLPAGPLQAETLRDALLAAVTGNPGLNAQRMTEPAAEAGVARARAGFLPQVTARGDGGWGRYKSYTPGVTETPSSTTKPRTAAIEMTQTLFDGGRTIANYQQAGHTLAATRFQLRDTEQGTALEATAAYLDVIRDQLVLDFERHNLTALNEQLRLIEGLFKFGDVTEVDVLQVRTRVSDAKARVATAEGTLKADSALYRQVIGRAPKGLQWPRPPVELLHGRIGPEHLQELVEQHPTILAAKATIRAAEAKLKGAVAGLGPTVSLVGSVERAVSQQVQGDRTNAMSVVGRVNMPLFSGGESIAGIKEARAQSEQRILELDAARARVFSDIARAEAQYRAAQERFSAVTLQLESAAKALKGLRLEFGIGQRTAVSVLDATGELLNANISLANAQRDKIASGFNLARALGRLGEADIRRLSNASDQPLRLFTEYARPVIKQDALALRGAVDPIPKTHFVPLRGSL